jgi:hypothetical protein
VGAIRAAAVAVTLAGALAACNDMSTPAAAPTPAATLATTAASPVVAAPTPSRPLTQTPTAQTPTAQIPSARKPPQRAVSQTAFRWSGRTVTTAELGKSWHHGCPVGAASLRAVTMTFWGFDHKTHTGTLIVNARVVSAVADAFRQIYAARFPIRQMVPIAAYGGDDNKSMAADNTSGFNCRAAVSNGPKTWSMHAFGEAIDINTVENPYTLDGTVRPPSGKPYTDRSNVRPGMVVRGSAPTRAFSAVGWGWGGNWSSSPDYQHFSSNGK